jgi:hypothetical protein
MARSGKGVLVPHGMSLVYLQLNHIYHKNKDLYAITGL